jgi:hypothetical protein
MSTLNMKTPRVSADDLCIPGRDYVHLLYDMVGKQWYSLHQFVAREWCWSPITREQAVSLIEAGALISYHTV